MSMTDFRRLIDIHGGHFIGVECVNGRTIELSVDGLAAKFDIDNIEVLETAIRQQMTTMLEDGMKKFELSLGGNDVLINYYDAGMVLDAIVGARKYLA